MVDHVLSVIVLSDGRSRQQRNRKDNEPFDKIRVAHGFGPLDMGNRGSRAKCSSEISIFQRKSGSVKPNGVGTKVNECKYCKKSTIWSLPSGQLRIIVVGGLRKFS